MIAPDYCVTTARYNAWQNDQMHDAMAALDDGALRAERGAVFGSILATANHLLWADLMWMARLDGGTPPGGGIAESLEFQPTLATWRAERFRCDRRLILWAERLGAIDLTGDLSFDSAALGRNVTAPVGLCVMHMFNHQTHHRGQIHAMLTAAGATPPVSDLFLMPEEC